MFVDMIRDAKTKIELKILQVELNLVLLQKI